MTQGKCLASLLVDTFICATAAQRSSSSIYEKLQIVPKRKLLLSDQMPATQSKIPAMPQGLCEKIKRLGTWR